MIGYTAFVVMIGVGTVISFFIDSFIRMVRADDLG